MTLCFLVTRPLVHHTGEASSTIHTTSPSACTDANTQMHEHEHSVCQAAAEQIAETKSGLKKIKPSASRWCFSNPKWQIICGGAFSVRLSSRRSGCSVCYFGLQLNYFSFVFTLPKQQLCSTVFKKILLVEARLVATNQVPKFSAARHVVDMKNQSRCLCIIKRSVWPAITMEGVLFRWPL